MADKVLKLSKRYEPPGETPFDRIVLREPTYQDIIMSGKGFPQEGQPNGHGGVMVVTYHEVVDFYAQRLIISPEYKDIAGLNFADTKKLQDGICDFFHTAAPTGSPAPPTSSSSGSDGTQLPSSG
ncbi:hypothetical protein ASC97_04280 [Rhizobium sp. Root1203]|uniref:hypothetical protein n=1 Tax=Rhizobium sp. Root1203 TaxID=1736427 RepID=UPI000710F997|nr:hypothetical protein [Rhizobium sp. Root1203]KQV27601.1 hypothetical protein ASC97_04280 [Rhizobium sp. Root1203]